MNIMYTSQVIDITYLQFHTGNEQWSPKWKSRSCLTDSPPLPPALRGHPHSLYYGSFSEKLCCPVSHCCLVHWYLTLRADQTMIFDKLGVRNKQIIDMKMHNSPVKIMHQNYAKLICNSCFDVTLVPHSMISWCLYAFFSVQKLGHEIITFCVEVIRKQTVWKNIYTNYCTEEKSLRCVKALTLDKTVLSVFPKVLNCSLRFVVVCFSKNSGCSQLEFHPFQCISVATSFHGRQKVSKRP